MARPEAETTSGPARPPVRRGAPRLLSTPTFSADSARMATAADGGSAVRDTLRHHSQAPNASKANTTALPNTLRRLTFIPSGLEDRREAWLHDPAEADHIPVGKPDAARAFGPADRLGRIGAVDTVMLLCEVEP